MDATEYVKWREVNTGSGNDWLNQYWPRYMSSYVVIRPQNFQWILNPDDFFYLHPYISYAMYLFAHVIILIVILWNPHGSKAYRGHYYKISWKPWCVISYVSKQAPCIIMFLQRHGLLGLQPKLDIFRQTAKVAQKTGVLLANIVMSDFQQ